MLVVTEQWQVVCVAVKLSTVQALMSLRAEVLVLRYWQEGWDTGQ